MFTNHNHTNHITIAQISSNFTHITTIVIRDNNLVCNYLYMKFSNFNHIAFIIKDRSYHLDLSIDHIASTITADISSMITPSS